MFETFHKKNWKVRKQASVLIWPRGKERGSATRSGSQSERVSIAKGVLIFDVLRLHKSASFKLRHFPKISLFDVLSFQCSSDHRPTPYAKRSNAPARDFTPLSTSQFTLFLPQNSYKKPAAVGIDVGGHENPLVLVE